MTKGSTSILARQMYGVAEAAALLGLRTDRTRAWLDGYEREGSRFAPVIPVEPSGEDVVTWGVGASLSNWHTYASTGAKGCPSSASAR